MRLLKARLRGYAGVYRGSKGLEEIIIDFSNCKHNIILIEGPNGSGKTTILNALQPLPDSNNVLIRGVPAEKELLYLHEDKLYQVLIIHGIKQDRSRAITKAYLTEIIDGNEIELNPNGNIGSYKDILYDRFGLDPNFTSLSHLSLDDKGIVEKTPSDRKRFVTDILDTVEVYNDIHKKLSKKSISYRSLLTSIVTKIDNIGNRSALETNLEALVSKVNQLQSQKESLINDLARYEASIYVVDPDGKIQDRYYSLRNTLSELKSSLNRIEVSLIKYKDMGINDLFSATTLYNDKSSLIINLESQITAIKANLETMIQLKDNDLVSIQNKTARLNSLTSDYNYKDLEKKIKELKISLDQCITVFHKIGLDENHIMTKDEFVLAINTVKDIKDMIDNIKGSSNHSDFQDAIIAILNQSNIVSEINQRKLDKEQAQNQLSQIEKDISYYEGIAKTISILDNRPSDCMVDSCPFIKDALYNQSLEPIAKLDKLGSDRLDIINYIKTLEKEIERLSNIQMIISSINIIIRNINLNKNILNKIPKCKDLFKDINTFLMQFTSNNFYHILEEINDFGKYSNIFEIYKTNKELLSMYESEYAIYTQKATIIDEINTDLDELNNKVNIIISKIQSENKSLQEKSILLEETKSFCDTLVILIQLYKDKVSIKQSIKDTQENIDKLSNDMNNIIDNSVKVDEINKELVHLTIEIDNNMSSIQSIKYSLKQLEEYEKEYKEYTQKYNTIELIKKYTSPTKEGIQTLFVQLYMSKTLNTANELLALFFNGAMELLPYVINDNEFRIPCHNTNSNIINDDINSCSSSEKSIISMLISFALLQQSSTKYNILRLDEVDGVLDQINRSSYLTALDLIMNKLNVETCFVISHSSEFDSSNVDVIYLGNNTQMVSGNIIFTYYD